MTNRPGNYQQKSGKVQIVLASVLLAIAAVVLAGMIVIALNELKKNKEVTVEISSLQTEFFLQPSKTEASVTTDPSAAQSEAGNEEMKTDSGSDAPEETAGEAAEANAEQAYSIVRLSRREDLIIEDTLYGRGADTDQAVSMYSPEEDIVIGSWRTQAGTVWHDCFKFWVGGENSYSPTEYVIFSLKDLEAQTAMISIACGEYSGDRCQRGTQMYVCIYVDGVLVETVSDVTDDPAYGRKLEIDVTGAEKLKIEVGSFSEIFGECIIDAALRCAQPK